MTAGRTNACSISTDWNTPTHYVESVRVVFSGVIGLDPCSNEHSVVGATNEFRLPTDGLLSPWNASTVYVNPPYGRDPLRGTSIKDWLSKCAAFAIGGGEVIALVPVAPNTSHWKRFVFPVASRICFLHEPRVKFTMAGEATKGAPMACAMIYWGNNPDLFTSAFLQHGTVMSAVS